MMNAEYVVLLDRIDGSKQAMQGLESVGNITSTFPHIDVSKAINELRNSDPGNKELQQLRVPQYVGGDVDILLGIQYECVHPIQVHRLPCGLTIYNPPLRQLRPRS